MTHYQNMKYFAYGSNLCVPRLEKRGCDPSNPRLAVLPGHRLVFNKYSVDGSMKANIEPSDGQEVWGVVFQISEDRLDGLRRAEGYPAHYGEHSVTVLVHGVRETVTTYIACPDKIREPGRPFGWYLDHIRNGAQKFGFPPDYVQMLNAVVSDVDQDAGNDLIERAYWSQPVPSTGA